MSLSERLPNEERVTRLEALARDDPARALIDGLALLRDIDSELTELYRKRLAISSSPNQRRRDEGSLRRLACSMTTLGRSIELIQQESLR